MDQPSSGSFSGKVRYGLKMPGKGDKPGSCGAQPPQRGAERLPDIIGVFLRTQATLNSPKGCLKVVDTFRRTDQTAPCLAPRHSNCLACRTAEACWPPQLLQVDCTRIVTAELSYEFTVRVWETSPYRQVVLHARSGSSSSCKTVYRRRS
jgi:hypothetical protein